MHVLNFIAVLFMLGLSSLCESNAVFLQVPSDTEAKTGDTVVLQCAVHISHSCRVLWYRPYKQTYISDGTSILRWAQELRQGKYSVVGNSTNGEYFLQVKNITVEDAGIYQCSCGSASRRMELKVMQPPMKGYPMCEIEGGTEILYAGDEISLTCISKGGEPPATMTWFHNGIPSQNMQHNVQNFVKVRYFTYAMPIHNGSVFVCTAESPAFTEKKNCTIGPLTILSPLTMASSLTEDFAIMDADERDERGVTFSCGLKPNFTNDALINTTWFVDGEAIHSNTNDFELIDNGQTLLLKEHTMKKIEIEVSCQVHMDGRSLGNITRLIEIAPPVGKDIGYDTKGLPDNPYIYKPDDETTNVIDIRPLIILNACVIIVMLLLILLAVYSPKICNCYSPIYQEPKSCKPSSSHSKRHADSRITELHFVQSDQCRTGVARCEGSHFYETPNGGTSNQHPAPQINNAPPLPPSQLQSSQEMQATFHVVVHSRNGGGISQTVHKVTNETTTTPIPHAATVTPVNSSNNNSGSVCCVYAPVRKKSKGNLYTEDKTNFQPQSHYQRVVGPPRVAEHLLQHPDNDEGVHEKLLNESLGEDFNSHITSPCSTLPSNSKLSHVPLSYSRTLPLTPLERNSEAGASICCGDFSDDDLDSIYANIASIEDIHKQTTL